MELSETPVPAAKGYLYGHKFQWDTHAVDEDSLYKSKLLLFQIAYIEKQKHIRQSLTINDQSNAM